MADRPNYYYASTEELADPWFEVIDNGEGWSIQFTLPMATPTRGVKKAMICDFEIQGEAEWLAERLNQYVFDVADNANAEGRAEGHSQGKAEGRAEALAEVDAAAEATWEAGDAMPVPLYPDWMNEARQRFATFTTALLSIDKDGKGE